MNSKLYAVGIVFTISIITTIIIKEGGGLEEFAFLSLALAGYLAANFASKNRELPFVDSLVDFNNKIIANKMMKGKHQYSGVVVRARNKRGK